MKMPLLVGSWAGFQCPQMCLNTGVKTQTVEQTTILECSLLDRDFAYLAKLMWLVPKLEETYSHLVSTSLAGLET